MTRRLAVLCLVVAPTILRAQEATEVGRLVERLGAGDYQARVDAEAALEAMGEAARPDLEAAAAGADLEVRERARRILGRIDLQFLEGGAIERWKPELAAALRSRDEVEAIQAGEALVEALRLRRDAPWAVEAEAARALRHLSRRAPGERGHELRLGLLGLGDAEGILEFARTGRPRDAVGVMRSMSRLGGSYDGFVEALDRTEGAERTRVETLLWHLWFLAGAWSPPAEWDRARLLAAIRRVPPQPGSQSARHARAAVEVDLGEAGAFVRYLEAEHRDGGGLAAMLQVCRDSERRRVEVAATAGLYLMCVPPIDIEVEVQPWFAGKWTENFGDWVAAGSPRVREVAALWAGMHGQARHAGAIRARLDDEDHEVRLAAAWALAELGARDEALAAARRAVESSNAEEVRDARWLLEWWAAAKEGGR